MLFNLALVICVGGSLVITTIELFRTKFVNYIVWAVWLLAIALAISRLPK